MSNKKTIQKNINSSEDSFIFLLHEESIFDKKHFYELIKSTSEEAFNLGDIEREKLINIYIYTLKTFIYHFDNNDSSEIINFIEIHNEIACYVELIDYIILNLSMKKEISFIQIEKIISEYEE